jgi:hypothetical protein
MASSVQAEDNAGLARALDSASQREVDSALRLISCILLGIPTGTATIDAEFLLPEHSAVREVPAVSEVCGAADAAEFFALIAVRIPRCSRLLVRFIRQQLEEGASCDQRPFLLASSAHLGRLVATAASLYSVQPSSCELLHSELGSAAAEAAAEAVTVCVDAGFLRFPADDSHISASGPLSSLATGELQVERVRHRVHVHGYLIHALAHAKRLCSC